MKKLLITLMVVAMASFLFVGCLFAPPNQTPIITSDPITTATLGADYTYDVEATDPDGDTLIYFLTVMPSGMTIDVDTGLIIWTPPAEGDYNVTVNVSDGDLDITQPFIITVGEFVLELIGIEVEPETVTLCTPITKGLDETFTVTANYNDDTDKVVTSDCIYGVDDTSIVTVTAGEVTALKVGTATISISYTEEGITKGTTLNVIVEGTIEIRWFEDAVRYNAIGGMIGRWPDNYIPASDFGDTPAPEPATLILTGGGYHFDDVNEYFNFSPLEELEGSIFIDEEGQLTGNATYIWEGLSTEDNFVGQVEIIMGENITGFLEDKVTPIDDDHDGIMVGTYTQKSYKFGTKEEVTEIGAYKDAILCEGSENKWFVGYTIYTAHGEDPTG